MGIQVSQCEARVAIEYSLPLRAHSGVSTARQKTNCVVIPHYPPGASWQVDVVNLKENTVSYHTVSIPLFFIQRLTDFLGKAASNAAVTSSRIYANHRAHNSEHFCYRGVLDRPIPQASNCHI